MLAPIIRDFGWVQASDDELVETGATRRFLPHGLGHSLGIQVHDVGMRRKPAKAENPYLRNTSTVEVGQVFTVEPGCYFIASLLEELRTLPIASKVNWAAIDELRPFGGIRIEDNVVVKEGGVRNLTREAAA
jgi:Xaa-Pro dipeptidase